MLPKSYVRKVWNKAIMPVLDFFTIVVFAIITYELRYEWQLSWFTDTEIFSKTRTTNYNDFVKAAIVFAIICVLYFSLIGIYRIGNKISSFSEHIQLALGVIIVMGWMIVYLFFNEYSNNFLLYNTIRLSKFLASFGVIFVILGLYLQRGIIRIILRQIRLSKYFANNIVFLGTHPDDTLKAVEAVENNIIIDKYDNLSEDDFGKIKRMIQNDRIQEIYVNHRINYVNDLILLCERYKIITHIYDADTFHLKDSSLRAYNLDEHIYFELRYSALEGWGVVFKRLFDIVFSATFILVFCWLYIIIMIAIYLEDKGNPFYGSVRTGADGKEFEVYKFRRLKMKYCTSDKNPEALLFEQELIKTKDARNDGVLYKIVDDPRATKVGKFLEKTSLDELPQFFNVLIGNLSVVGPRPHQPREVAKYSPHHFKVLNIKPGITGLAQINGRSDISFDQEVVFDSNYVKNWSFWLDLKIILLTPLKLFKSHKS